MGKCRWQCTDCAQQVYNTNLTDSLTVNKMKQPTLLLTKLFNIIKISFSSQHTIKKDFLFAIVVHGRLDNAEADDLARGYCLW